MMVVNIHAPSSGAGRVKLAGEIKRSLLKYKASHTFFFGGDMNCIMNPTLESMGGSKQKDSYDKEVQKGAKELHRVFTHFGTEDVYRTTIEPEGTAITRQPDKLGAGTPSRRLDKWYTPTKVGVVLDLQHIPRTELALRPKLAVKGKLKCSDHWPVTFRWTDQTVEFGSDHWKMPSWLFTDPNYIKLMSAEIRTHLPAQPITPHTVWREGEGELTRHFRGNFEVRMGPKGKWLHLMGGETRSRPIAPQGATHQWWEALKLKISIFTRRYCKEQATQRKAYEKQVIADITAAETDLQKFGEDPNTRRDLQLCIAKLEKVEYFRSEGYRVRAGAWKSLNMDNTTKANFARLRPKASATVFPPMLDPDTGEHVEETEDILKLGKKFWKGVYVHRDTCDDAAKQITALVDKKFPATACAHLDGDLTFIELQTALRGSSNGKAPGIDGIPNDFYKIFHNLLLRPLYETLQDEIGVGDLGSTKTKSVIVQLYKKKERDLFKNYRPISLLCSDYKLYTSVLAKRLSSVVHHVIPACQTGFTPGRFICENTMFTSMLIEYLTKLGKPGVLLMWDAEKAYDRISWVYLKKMMGAFGVPPAYQHMVDMCYKPGQVSSAIMVNGHMSSFFPLGASVRQGCPLSCCLFLLAVEGLGLLLDKHPSLAGGRVNLPDGQEIIRTMFADDTTVYLNSVEFVVPAIRVAGIYERASGSKLNEDKTIGMWMGTNIGSPPPKHFSYESWLEGFQEEKALGHCIGVKGVTGSQWPAVFARMEERMQQWKKIHAAATPYGKVMAAKVHICSCMWYLVQVHNPPKKLLKDFSTKLWSFVLQADEVPLDKRAPGGAHWITKRGLQDPRAEGGIGALNLENEIKAFQAKWVCRFLEPAPSPWKVILTHWLDKATKPWGLGARMLLSNCKLDLSASPMPRFWRAAFSAWYQASISRVAEPTTFEEVLSEPLWANARMGSLIALKWQPMAEAKYHRICDLWDREDEKFISHQETGKQISPAAYAHLLAQVPREWVDLLQGGCLPLGVGEWAAAWCEDTSSMTPPYGQVVQKGGTKQLKEHNLAMGNELLPTGQTIPYQEDEMVRTIVIPQGVQGETRYTLVGDQEESNINVDKWGITSTTHSHTTAGGYRVGSETETTLLTKIDVKLLYTAIQSKTKVAHTTRWQVHPDRFRAKLRRLSSQGICKKAAHLCNRVLHKRLYIGDRVMRLGGRNDPSRGNAFCPRHNTVETHTHLFHDCHQDLVETFLGWWKHCTREQLCVNSKEEWVTGILPSSPGTPATQHQEVWDQLHSLVIRFIWVNRCKEKFDDCNYGSDDEDTTPPVPHRVLWGQLVRQITLACRAEHRIATAQSMLKGAQTQDDPGEKETEDPLDPLTGWTGKWKEFACVSPIDHMPHLYGVDGCESGEYESDGEEGVQHWLTSTHMDLEDILEP